MSGALLVCGATSGAGKSTVASALCRIWSDAGRDVVPFKAQNMSNHAAVTADGGEIGRAQAMQALALPDGELAAIARRARDRTLDEHTAARRATEMVAAFEGAHSRELA